MDKFRLWTAFLNKVFVLMKKLCMETSSFCQLQVSKQKQREINHHLKQFNMQGAIHRNRLSISGCCAQVGFHVTDGPSKVGLIIKVKQLVLSSCATSSVKSFLANLFFHSFSLPGLRFVALLFFSHPCSHDSP